MSLNLQKSRHALTLLLGFYLLFLGLGCRSSEPSYYKAENGAIVFRGRDLPSTYEPRLPQPGRSFLMRPEVVKHLNQESSRSEWISDEKSNKDWLLLGLSNISTVDIQGFVLKVTVYESSSTNEGLGESAKGDAKDKKGFEESQAEVNREYSYLLAGEAGQLRMLLTHSAVARLEAIYFFGLKDTNDLAPYLPPLSDKPEVARVRFIEVSDAFVRSGEEVELPILIQDLDGPIDFEIVEVRKNSLNEVDEILENTKTEVFEVPSDWLTTQTSDGIWHINPVPVSSDDENLVSELEVTKEGSLNGPCSIFYSPESDGMRWALTKEPLSWHPIVDYSAPPAAILSAFLENAKRQEQSEGHGWDSLDFGMTRDEVSSLLGEPQEGSPDWWFFDAEGQVSFDSGQLIAWTKPIGFRLSQDAARKLPWGQLKEGMTKSEVLNLFGQPCSAAQLNWGYGEPSVRGLGSIDFTNEGTVVSWRPPAL